MTDCLAKYNGRLDERFLKCRPQLHKIINQLREHNKRSIGQTPPKTTHLYLLSLDSCLVSLCPPLPLPLPVPLSVSLLLCRHRQPRHHYLPHFRLLLLLLLLLLWLGRLLLLYPCVSLLLPLLSCLLPRPLFGLPSFPPCCLFVDLQDGLKGKGKNVDSNCNGRVCCFRNGGTGRVGKEMG